jgi:hypothetical protein
LKLPAQTKEIQMDQETTTKLTPKHPLRDAAGRDARGLSEASESKWLRRPENLQEWHDALVELKQDIEAQFAERAADAQDYQNHCFAKGHSGKSEWFEFKAVYDRWKAGANRMKRSVEAKMRECKALLRKDQDDWQEKLQRHRVLLERCHRIFLGDGTNAPVELPLSLRDEMLRAIEKVLWNK